MIYLNCLKRKRNLLHGYEAGADENVVVVVVVIFSNGT